MKPHRENAPIEEEEGGEEYLLTKAAEQGFVTYDDILVAFPQAEESLPWPLAEIRNHSDFILVPSSPSFNLSRTDTQGPKKGTNRGSVAPRENLPLASCSFCSAAETSPELLVQKDVVLIVNLRRQDHGEPFAALPQPDAPTSRPFRADYAVLR